MDFQNLKVFPPVSEAIREVANLTDRKNLHTVAVSCSAVGYRFSWGRIGFLVDGQAGLCMGQCIGGAWVGAWVVHGVVQGCMLCLSVCDKYFSTFFTVFASKMVF